MGELIHETLIIDDFKSFRGHHEFNLGGRAGLFYLKGDNQVYDAEGREAGGDDESNGAGKSSLWHAFTWCWYGKTQDGLRNPDLQPWDSKGQIAVESVYRYEGRPHRLRRTANPNNITLDGEDITQDKLDALYGLSFEASGHTVVHGQDRPLFFDLEPRLKMELLVDVLGLGRWDERSKIAKQWAEQIEREIGGLDGDNAAATGALREVEDSLATTKANQAAWSDVLQKSIDQRGKQIKEDRAELGKIRKRFDEAALKNESAGVRAVDLEREITQLETYHDDASNKMATQSAKSQAAERKRSELRAELRLVEENEECPMCSQTINVRVLGGRIKAQIKEATEACDQAIGIFRTLQSQEINLKEQLVEARASLRQSREAERESQTTMNVLSPRVSVLEARIRTASTEIEQLRTSENPYGEEMRRLRDRRNELAAKQKKAEAQIKAYTAQIERTRFWVQGFKEVRLIIIQDALAQQQLIANSILEETGLIGWSLEYATESVTKKETVRPGIAIFVRPPGVKQQIRWESFSGGERQRLRLVGTLALAEVLLENIGLWVNLQVFDEPTAGLSSRGVADLVELLAEQARYSKRTIWFSDQHVVESAQFAGVVTAIRDRRGSYLEGS